MPREDSSRCINPSLSTRAAADASQTALEITLQSDNLVVSDSIDIQVKGIASKTINWTVNIQTTEAG